MDSLPTNYNGLLDWLSERAADQVDLVGRVDAVARAFVDLAAAAFRGELTSDLRSLFTQLRYLVLNIPSHLSTAEERVFIAVLRPLTRIDAYSWDDAPAVPPESAGRVYIIETGGVEDEFRLVIENQWHSVWSDYSLVTRDLSRRGIQTWNQFLLHGCERPRPLGLIWSSSEEHDVPYYVRVAKRFKEEVGLPDALEEGLRKWNAFTSNLPKAPPAFPGPDEALVNELARMNPVAGVDLHQTASAATYHLLRSYARWGGSAFLSIPVPLAARVHAVLSLCSESPIAENDLGRWRGIAGAVFPYLAASDLVSEFKLTEAKLDAADRQAAAWAHDVKNFTGPAHADLMDVRRRIASTIKDEQAVSALERATDAVLLLNAAAHARQLAGEASRIRRACSATARPVYALPLGVAIPVVTLALEYLLETRQEQVSQRSKGRFFLQWERRTQARRDVITEFAKLVLPEWDSIHPSLLSTSVLGHPSVVWPVALLREVVQNVRIVDPVPGSETVALSFSVALHDEEVVVCLQQEQIDGREWREGNVKGLERANDLYGETGAAVGSIKVLKLICDPLPPVRGREKFQIRYGVEVRLRVAKP